MTPNLMVILLLIVTSLATLAAVNKDCVLHIEETDKKWNLYQITETIGLTALRCNMKIEYQDICGGKSLPAIPIDRINWASNKDCVTAFKTKRYPNKDVSYPLPTTNEDILVDSTTNNCLKTETLVSVEQVSVQVAPSTDMVKLRSGIVCNATTGLCSGNKHWFLLGRSDQTPGTSYVFRRIDVTIEDGYFLRQKRKRYLIFERDSEEVALEIVSESLVDDKSVVFTDERGVVLSYDESIPDNWDGQVGEQLQTPHFIPKRDLVDALTKDCRMSDALQGKMVHEDFQGRIQLVGYYLSIFNTLCSLCILLVLGFIAYKKISCIVTFGAAENYYSAPNTNNANNSG